MTTIENLKFQSISPGNLNTLAIKTYETIDKSLSMHRYEFEDTFTNRFGNNYDGIFNEQCKYLYNLYRFAYQQEDQISYVQKEVIDQLVDMAISPKNRDKINNSFDPAIKHWTKIMEKTDYFYTFINNYKKK